MRGAAAAFRVDLGNASHDLVLVRAAQIRASCDGANAPLRAVERLIAAEVYDVRTRGAQERLRSGTTELRRYLGLVRSFIKQVRLKKPAVS